MNNIRKIQELNKRELENGVLDPDASWHADFRDSAYIYIGGLPFELSEGDVITIFSQFGEPTSVNIVRDKDTGKSRGYAFLMYEDQRSTDLAVDNLNGITIMNRMIRVDHTRYKRKEKGAEDGQNLTGLDWGGGVIEDDGANRSNGSNNEEKRPMLKEEHELALLISDHDEDDPMKAFLIQEKREQVLAALARLDGSKNSGNPRRKRHNHSHRHRATDEYAHSRQPSRRDRDDYKRHVSRSRDQSLERTSESDEARARRRHRSKRYD